MRAVRAGLLLSLTLALLGVSVACGGGGDAEPSATGTGSAQQDVTRERDGVELHLSVDKAVYGPDDSVVVRATVTNTTASPVEYVGKTFNTPGFTLTVVSVLAGEQPLGDPTGEQMTGTLGAGQEITLEREWDKKLAIRNTPPAAPPGNYLVNAVFLMSRAGFADPVELSAAVGFDIEGTGLIQPPVSVVKAMVSDERVKAWLDGRGESVVCAYPPLGLFFNGFPVTNAAAETFDFLYTAQQANRDPICGIATDGDSWLLVIFAPKGGQPDRLSVRIALDRQEVLEVTEGGPTPVPTATP